MPTKAELEAAMAAAQTEAAALQERLDEALEALRSLEGARRPITDDDEQPRSEAALQVPEFQEFLDRSKVLSKVAEIEASKPNIASVLPSLPAGYQRQLSAQDAIFKPLAEAAAVFRTDLSAAKKYDHAKPLIEEGEWTLPAICLSHFEA